MKIERLLVNTDLSPCARQAYAPAADLARRFGARVDLLHCLDCRAPALKEELEPIEGALEAFRMLRRRALEREAAGPPFKGLAVVPHLLEGPGPELIRRFTTERGTDLVVQSSHGYTGWKRLWMGSFAERVLRTSAVPVLTFKVVEALRPEEAKPFQPRRILFPYDFSEAGRQALEPLRTVARAYGSRVLAFHVWRSPAELLGLGEAAEHVPELAALSLSSGGPEKPLGDLREFAGRELQGIEHECQVMTGDPASQIVFRAGTFEADLVCMATHGRTGLTRFLLGSVAEKVLRGVSCPILVVRPAQGKEA